MKAVEKGKKKIYISIPTDDAIDRRLYHWLQYELNYDVFINTPLFGSDRYEVYFNRRDVW